MTTFMSPRDELQAAIYAYRVAEVGTELASAWDRVEAAVNAHYLDARKHGLNTAMALIAQSMRELSCLN
jgi:hypothetical protein